MYTKTSKWKYFFKNINWKNLTTYYTSPTSCFIHYIFKCTTRFLNHRLQERYKPSQFDTYVCGLGSIWSTGVSPTPNISGSRYHTLGLPNISAQFRDAAVTFSSRHRRKYLVLYDNFRHFAWLRRRRAPRLSRRRPQIWSTSCWINFHWWWIAFLVCKGCSPCYERALRAAQPRRGRW